MIRSTLLAVGLLTLTACGGQGGGADAPNAAAAKQSPAAKQKTVFDDQLKALDKAKAVEKQLQEAKEKRDKEMEDQGG